MAERKSWKADVRAALAEYVYSEGCSCCRDSEAHDDRGETSRRALIAREQLAAERASEAPHTRTGNCWDDVPVRDGYIVDFCEAHDEPRGSCSVCAKCPTCGEEAKRV